MYDNSFEPIKVQIELEDKKEQERKLEIIFNRKKALQEWLKRFIFFAILLIPTLLSIVLHFDTKKDTIEYFKRLQKIKIPEKECQVFLNNKQINIKELITKKPVIQALGVYTEIGEISGFPKYVKRMISEIILRGKAGLYEIVVKDLKIYLKQGTWIINGEDYYRYVNVRIAGESLISPVIKYKFYKQDNYITSRRVR